MLHLLFTWVCQVDENQVIEATRFALDPYKVSPSNLIIDAIIDTIIDIIVTIFTIILIKVHHATLGKDDFLEPKKLPSGKDFIIVAFTDEFPDVDVKVKMLQQIILEPPWPEFGGSLFVHQNNPPSSQFCIWYLE